MTPRPALFLGIDTGGTFTDFVLYDGRTLRVHKRLSTPAAPEQAILAGIAALGLDPRGLNVVHGSTVATNAVLEGRGVRTAFITNRGFKDMLSIGRQARRELYDLQPAPLPPPVPPELCLETGGRLAADGALLEPLTEEDLATLRAQLRALRPRAAAINLLFSFLDPRGERAIAEIVPPEIFVSRSSEILPEHREYERGIATWLNAWVGPLVHDYLARLHGGLAGASVAVMQSSGDTMDVAEAGRRAVHMLLSGPAGGLAGARLVGESAGRQRLLAFDMGGTSTDAALIDGAPRLTGEGRIGPYPVAVPMVDLHTIGAGGGSIARLDAGGLLHVGPQSAGADPGPACYGRGGTEPTVTDAHLVLGRLRPEYFLGGTLRLDAQAARNAVMRIAAPLGLGAEEAALGIVRLADEHMARALRVISVQRGVDPRGYTLLSFGGAGGLHVCALAESLDMTEALIPVHAGVLSALGMLAAPRGRRLSRSYVVPLAEADEKKIAAAYAELTRQGGAELQREGVAADAIRAELTADLRYRGQTDTLNIEWRDAAGAAASFHGAHAARYGHRLDLPVELVNLRAALFGPRPEIILHGSADPDPPPRGGRDEVGAALPLWLRGEVRGAECVRGPALIVDAYSTVYLAPGWQCRADAHGNLLLARRR